MMIKTIFWEVNGEERKLDEEEYKKYCDYLENEERKCMYIGYVKVNEYGGFDIDICVKVEDEKLTIYVDKDWIPEAGYSWREEIIKKIEVE